MPYFFPTPAQLGPRARRARRDVGADRPARLRHDDADRPGNVEAARGAADAALTAADLVAAGAPAAYACCRPPGHHVTRAAYGGSCYLNNAALAAARLRDALGARSRSSTSTPTTATARRRSFADAATCSRAPSTSTRPRAGSRTSSASRARRAAAPGGATATSRSRPGAATGRGSRRCRGSRAGPHGARGARRRPRRRRRGRRPGEPAQVTEDGYREAGRALGGLGLPTVFVQEGGYDLATIGALVAATLAGSEGIATEAWRPSGWGRTSRGHPDPGRKDVKPPPHWRLEAGRRDRAAALARPRARPPRAVFIQDRDTSDVWLARPASRGDRPSG